MKIPLYGAEIVLNSPACSLFPKKGIFKSTG
jgi:hypothetical protein